MSNVIAFIPARGGSKGIPRKNIIDLGGKPLIVWTIEKAIKAGLDLVVNTDDEEIAEISRKHSAPVMYVPSEEAKERGIHQDNSSMYAVLKSEVPRIEPVPEIVVLLQPTVPFRKTMHIKSAIFLLARNPEYTSVVSVERVPSKYNPAQIVVNTPTGLRMADGATIQNRIQQRQKYQDAWIPTGSIYAFRTKNLEGGSFYGDNPMVMETQPEINIDTLSDLEEARQCVRSLQK